MPLNTKQIAVILGGVALSVLLYFAPSKVAQKEVGKAETNTLASTIDEASIKSWIDSVEKSLSDKDKMMLEKLKKLDKHLPDSLSVFWTMLNQPVPAAFYADKASKENPTADNFVKAGNRCYLATRYANNLSGLFFEMAILNFQAALKIDSTNLEAKTSLGACFVEGSQEPMKGITLLREVVAQDSTYIEAHLRLAMFAVQSGQYEKAIERYERILRIKPSFNEAYLYMGEVYANMGEKEKAIQNLEKFKSLSNDALVDSEIDKYINQIKNS